MSVATELVGPEAARQARQRSKLLDVALRELSSDELLVLTMRIRGNFSLREAGDVLGKSHMGIACIEQKALSKLRLYFEQFGVRSSADLF